ncbi:MAG: hypothetical protein II823_00235 [Kiritimatiellae bacterium]|nr:hypothetical protein [Kiritimatiellia bacterium]
MNPDKTTFADILSAYTKAARAERAATGSPCESTVKTNIGTTRNILKRCNISEDAPLSSLTRQMLADYVVQCCECGRPLISIKSDIERLNALFAIWTEPHYEYLLGAELGRAFRFPVPRVKASAQRYTRPARELLMAVKAWYANLQMNARCEGKWIAATLMLEFAMRNGDIGRLRWDNIVEKDGRCYLSYTPHKTKLSSGRIVVWPVHDDIWKVLKAIKAKSRNELVLPRAAGQIARITRELRSMGFRGSKGAYELRKICIDHVYQNYGAEMATSISGDNLKTILRYYADPSALNVMGVRIFDLIK